eukprot:8146365-Pyramimonas_sp.AAC.1
MANGPGRSEVSRLAAAGGPFALRPVLRRAARRVPARGARRAACLLPLQAAVKEKIIGHLASGIDRLST